MYGAIIVAYKTKYKPINISKYIGNPKNIICRSLWERRVCRYLDENSNVLKWGSEELIIPYFSPIDRKMHRYYPDFIVEKVSKKGSVETLVIEVKPKRQTIKPEKKKKKEKTFLKECITFSINEAKWKAAEKLCRENEWQFIILTEDDILT
jgi:hypothetical protein|tara:strand:- start:117 stop:569 length:453 start_codon:yes stop_codon:yes gene_type:complete